MENTKNIAKVKEVDRKMDKEFGVGFKAAADLAFGTIAHATILSNFTIAALELSAAKAVAKSEMGSFWKCMTVLALGSHASELVKKSWDELKAANKASEEVSAVINSNWDGDSEESSDSAESEDKEDLNDDPDITVSE